MGGERVTPELLPFNNSPVSCPYCGAAHGERHTVPEVYQQ